MNTKDLESAHQIASKVDGWLTLREGALLFELASQVQGKGALVEIGSWQGKSTIYIAKALSAHKVPPQFYAVDPHVGSEEHWKDGKKVWTLERFKKNIKDAGVEPFVTPVVRYSHDYAREIQEPVEFVFIDGAHDYASVERDYQDWFPQIVEGGVIAFHDTYAGGDPYKVLRKYLYVSPKVGSIRRVDSITYVRKLRSTWHTRLCNRLKRVKEDSKIVIRKSRLLSGLLNKLKRSQQ